MWIAVVSILPDLVRAGASHGVLGRAVSNRIVALELHDPRDHTSDRHRTVDDRPYGGGPGMVMMAEPMIAAVEAARASAGRAGLEAPVISLSPQGERFDQSRARQLAALPGLILVAGRYEGLDERVTDAVVDAELSIGDFVLTGGELAALVVLDAVSRHLPGTLGNAASAVEESHLDGLLDYPHYTRPEICRGAAVPGVLTGGDHGAIQRWRQLQALRQTWLKRPDLLTGRPLSELERALLGELFESGLGAAGEPSGGDSETSANSRNSADS